jgi:hypothetical protein
LAASLLVAALVIVLAVAGGLALRANLAGDTPSGRLFVDAYGRCPIQQGNARPGAVCGYYKNFNAHGGVFALQTVPWGIAYSFNCGRKPHAFYAVVEWGDGGFASAEIARNARQGQGYHMETVANVNRNPAQLPAYLTVEEISIRSSCAWHVRAVDGTPKDLRTRIPPIPPLYRMNSGDLPVQDPSS